MLASSRVMDSLKGIGLNLYERRLWVALLARGTSTAGELSEIANVPRSRTYDILQSLANKGFVVAQTSKPMRYVAVPPEEALDRVKQKLAAEVLEAQERIDNLKESPVITELNSLFSKGLKIVAPAEMTGSLKGVYSVNQQIGSMFKDANKSIQIMTTYDGIDDIFTNHFDALRKAKERGVTIRIATHHVNKKSEKLKSISNLAEVRFINKKDFPLAGKFFVIDSKEMLLPLTDSNLVHATQNMALWSRSNHVAGGVLIPLFNLVWSHSKPLK
jgi:sugar-specific transcriptional regulator TrmB